MLKRLVIVVGLALAACSSVADRAPTTIAAAEIKQVTHCWSRTGPTMRLTLKAF